jgi:hypothetical protein
VTSAAQLARSNADGAKLKEASHARNATAKVDSDAGLAAATRDGPAVDAAAPEGIPRGIALDAKGQESSDAGAVTERVSLAAPDAKATGGSTANPATAPGFLDAIRAKEPASGIAPRARA